MDFLKLEINNFMALAEGEVDLQNRGLVLVEGLNEDDTSADSNGAGKSTLFNAILWCLYGKTANNVKADDVVNRSAGKDCRVALTLEDGGETYQIARHRKHKTNKNRVTIKSTMGDLTKGTDKLTDDFIEKLVGSSASVFLASVYGSQENMTDLPSMSDSFLKQIVEEAAGIDQLTSAYEKVCVEFNSKSHAVDIKENELSHLKTTMSATKEGMRIAKTSSQQWRDNKAKTLVECRKNYRLALDEVASARGLIASESSIKEIKQEIESLQDQLDSQSHYSEKFSEAQKQFLLCQGKIDTLKKKIQDQKDSFESAKSKRDQADSSIGQPCSECGKPYTESDLAHVRRSHQQKMSDAKSIAADAKTQIDGLNLQLSALEEAVNKAKADIPDTSAITKKLSELNKMLVNDELKKQSLYHAQANSLVKNGDLKREKATEDPHQATIASHKQNGKQTLLAIKETEQSLSELKDELAYLEAAKKVYSPKGVRNQILNVVTPFLNNQTSKYLSVLSDDQITAEWITFEKNSKGETKDKFTIKVNHQLGGSSFASMSGGEKRKIRLATCLALQDLVSQRATKSINLYLGDEIDNALDESGLERLMSILVEKSKTCGTVFVVSHNDLKTWISDSIIVKKSGGKSVI